MQNRTLSCTQRPEGLSRRNLFAAGGAALVTYGLVAGCTGNGADRADRAAAVGRQGFLGNAVALDPTDIGTATAPFSLPELPYARDALAPHISAETFEYHHGKHHQGYVNNLNELVGDAGYAGTELATIVARSEGAVYQNAGQVWNHSFFWRCLAKDGGGQPNGDLATAIDRDFGSYAAFRRQFKHTATGQFGSGWAWLVYANGKLAVMSTANADGPLRHGKVPLLTVDVWEHAYYIDYRNRRGDFVDAVLDNLVDWRFVGRNLAAATGS